MMRSNDRKRRRQSPEYSNQVRFILSKIDEIVDRTYALRSRERRELLGALERLWNSVNYDGDYEAPDGRFPHLAHTDIAQALYYIISSPSRSIEDWGICEDEQGRNRNGPKTKTKAKAE